MLSVYLIVVVTSALIGAVSATIASRTRRDPLLWFVYGVIFNVFALAILATASQRRNVRGTSARS